MKRNPTIIALIVGLTVISVACSKPGTANMSEDDRHKLFQAAGRTADAQLGNEVTKKLGLSDSRGPTPAFQPFVEAHVEWVMKNADFVQEMLDVEKARAYVKAHLP